MATLTTSADPAAAGAGGRIVRCERVEVSEKAALIRVTVALEGMWVREAAHARLLVVDGTERSRRDPLPAQLSDGAETITLGFALSRAARALALELGGRLLPLPAPALRSLDLAERRQRRLERARQDVEQQLRSLQARLDEARATSAAVTVERDQAQRDAARAEVAAHDATARAEALERGLAGGGQSRRTRQRAGAAIAIGSLCAAAIVALLAWPERDGSAERAVTGIPAANTAARMAPDPLAAQLQIPVDYLELYQRAGARYGLDWTRLAAVGAIESRHGQARIAGVLSGANSRGASGPAQFLAGTWERFGVDGDGDGRRDPHAAADAITAMASYLRASGAPQDWHGALRSYNHSDAYANAVERLAATYRRRAGEL